MDEIPRKYPACAHCDNDGMAEISGELLCLDHIKEKL